MKRVGRLEGGERGRQDVQPGHVVVALDRAQGVRQVPPEPLAVYWGAHPSSSVTGTPRALASFFKVSMPGFFL